MKPETRVEIRRRRLLIILALVPALAMVGLLMLRPLGLLRPFKVPTGAMAPAVSPGDHVFMEGISYLSRKPRKGEIVVFRVEKNPVLPPAIYLSRVAGEPGDRLRIIEEQLFVNDVAVTLSNAAGPIRYVSFPGTAYLASSNDTVTVPAGSYFVLGDNTTNSLDSRFYGFLPAGDILGRVWVCYSPLSRAGKVK